MNKIKKVTFYECPVCGKNSSDRKEIERHYKSHTIKAEEVCYCSICGEGWYSNAWGAARAAEMARKCYQKHIDEGDIDEVATRAFFFVWRRLRICENLREGKRKWRKLILNGRIVHGIR